MKILLTTLFVTITLVACKKYDDGGYFSKTRIEGEWQTEKETVTIFGQVLDPSAISQDSTSSGGLNMGMKFSKNGDFEYTIESLNNTGEGIWKFSDDKEYVEIVAPLFNIRGLIKKYKGNELDLEFNLQELLDGFGASELLGEFLEENPSDPSNPISSILASATYNIELVKL